MRITVSDTPGRPNNAPDRVYVKWIQDSKGHWSEQLRSATATWGQYAELDNDPEYIEYARVFTLEQKFAKCIKAVDDFAALMNGIF